MYEVYPAQDHDDQAHPTSSDVSGYGKEETGVIRLKILLVVWILSHDKKL